AAARMSHEKHREAREIPPRSAANPGAPGRSARNSRVVGINRRASRSRAASAPEFRPKCKSYAGRVASDQDVARRADWYNERGALRGRAASWWRRESSDALQGGTVLATRGHDSAAARYCRQYGAPGGIRSGLVADHDGRRHRRVRPRLSPPAMGEEG